jgi:hypothetical protein
VEWQILLALYAIGALIMCGIRGGIRDEMDGIADLFAVFIWPIWIAAKTAFFVAGVFVNIGIAIRKAIN